MRNARSLKAAMTAGLGALALFGALAADAATAEVEIAKGGLAQTMNRLGSETIGSLAAPRGDRTVIVSPYGLGSALHLLSLGASGPAKKSLQTTLVPPGVKAQEHTKGLMALQQQVRKADRDKLKLTMASAVFVPKSAKPSAPFVESAGSVFNARLETLDFSNASALQRINAWGKEASRGLIPQVIEQLDADARFVLANVVYFNGAWETAFDAGRTAPAAFTRADGSKRDIAMMDASLPVDFAEFDNFQAIQLPYDGKDVAMLVIAPGAKQGPTLVAQALKSKSLYGLMAAAQKQMRKVTVQVRLPRFRAESDLDVTVALSLQGLRPALSASSDYGAINKAKGALQVVHRAVLEVTEAGTKAAAATAVTSDRSLVVTPIFSADRPFAFAIVHRPTQAMLFAGYIADPGNDPGPAPVESKIVR